MLDDVGSMITTKVIQNTNNEQKSSGSLRDTSYDVGKDEKYLVIPTKKNK